MNDGLFPNKEIGKQIAQCLNLFKDTLAQDLLGVYLYGSSVLGGLQPYSDLDLDLFVVSNRPTTHDEKVQLVTDLLTISAVGYSKPQRPIDITQVVRSEVSPWRYPPMFDFKYGDWLRQEYQAGNVEPWDTRTMPAFALLLTQVLLASKTLFGPPPEVLLAAVPYQDFLKATVVEMDQLMPDLAWDTRNVLLTYARIWSTVQTDAIRSKPDAAAWVLEKFPVQLQPVMQRARAVCLGREADHWDDLQAQAQSCAMFMVSRIKEQMALLMPSDSAQRIIKLAVRG